jgi:hypothetical protein
LAIIGAHALLYTSEPEALRAVLRDVPMALVTEAWRPYIREPDGRISRRYYELCTLWHLRSALRAGNIWVAHSRRYANPETCLIPPAEWPRWRPEVRRQPGTPLVRLPCHLAHRRVRRMVVPLRCIRLRRQGKVGGDASCAALANPAVGHGV